MANREGAKAAIEIGHVSYRYDVRVALDSVSLLLSADRVVLLGPNGAGKSTLLKLIATVLPGQKGKVLLSGHDLSTRAGRVAARRDLGYVPQSMSLPLGWSCEEFLAYACWMHGESEYRTSVGRALSGVGLSGRATSRIRTLSGGMRQRLCVAQALVHQPSVLVVDEPTVGLDPLQRVRVRELLMSLDCQLVVATHLVDDVAAMGQQVVILDAGRVVFNGDISTLCGGREVSAAAVEAAYVARVQDRDAL